MGLKIGDVVRLKTGGPEMTVEAVDTNSSDVFCTWFAENASQRSRFKSLILRKVEQEPICTDHSSLFDGIDGR
jgi:uncharacterized protein YodC (DUF2158 family)